jgi:HSP20 family molecular chaperone IbpA
MTRMAGMGRLAEVGRSMAGTVVERMGRVAGRIQEASMLPADVLEDDDAYLVVFDAPGATASDVQVRYRRGAVEVRIDRFREHHGGFDMRFPGRGMSLDGRARLPAEARIDPDAATATLREDGTLEVRVPKRTGSEEGTSVVVEDVGVADADAAGS